MPMSRVIESCGTKVGFWELKAAEGIGKTMT